MQVGNATALRLKRLVEADPDALVRVLQFLQTRKLIPHSVASEWLGDEYLQVQIEFDRRRWPRMAFASWFKIILKFRGRFSMNSWPARTGTWCEPIRSNLLTSSEAARCCMNAS